MARNISPGTTTGTPRPHLLLPFLLLLLQAAGVFLPAGSASAADIEATTSPRRWTPLAQRLQRDSLYGPDVASYFLRLGDVYSPQPMSLKITELFQRKFLQPAVKPADPSLPRKVVPKLKVYPKVITPANVERCRIYLRLHSVSFAMMQMLYAVPPEIAVSLLFVETRLGAFLGKENAFMTLASMALSSSPDYIPDAIKPLPMTPERMEWVKLTMRQRSDWAYNELKALIHYARENKLDPLAMPASVYGAVGLCQFMPSNLKRFGADGNGDGKIDLFDPADAIMSVGSYLHGHGWTKRLSRSERHATLKRYNNSVVYANTILALADAVDQPVKKAAGPKAAKGGQSVKGKPAGAASRTQPAAPQKSLRKKAAPPPA